MNHDCLSLIMSVLQANGVLIYMLPYHLKPSSPFSPTTSVYSISLKCNSKPQLRLNLDILRSNHSILSVHHALVTLTQNAIQRSSLLIIELSERHRVKLTQDMHNTRNLTGNARLFHVGHRPCSVCALTQIKHPNITCSIACDMQVLVWQQLIN